MKGEAYEQLVSLYEYVIDLQESHSEKWNLQGKAEFFDRLFQVWHDLTNEIDFNLSDSDTNSFRKRLDAIQKTIEDLIRDLIERNSDKNNSDYVIKQAESLGERTTHFFEKIRQENESNNQMKINLSHKQQILLLHQLGFFKLEFFKILNETQKGVLIAHLLNRDEKNSEDYVRYSGGTKKIDSKFQIRTDANKKTVNELLEKVGLKDYKVR